MPRYHTQWAAQFYVAAELTRRLCIVSFTLGNAPRTDLQVTSPSGQSFRMEIKGLRTHNFWLIRKHDPDPMLFYGLVYIPPEGMPRFFILTSAEVQSLRQDYADAVTPRGRYRDETGGFNWTAPFPYENKWDKLPE